MLRMNLLSLAIVAFTSVTSPAEEPDAAVTTKEGRVLTFDPDWTPRPQEGDVPAYVKETDVDWVDDRLQRMDTGRTFNATFRYQHNGQDVTCYKGTAIRVGERGEAAWLYDRNQLRWCCAWECEPLTEPTEENPTGFTPYLNHSDRRFGLLNTPTPRGKMLSSTGPGAAWSNAKGVWDDQSPATAPLNRDNGWHHGLLKIRPRTISSHTFVDAADESRFGHAAEFPWTELVDGRRMMTLHIGYRATDTRRRRLLSPGSFEAAQVETAEVTSPAGTISTFRMARNGGIEWLSVFCPQADGGPAMVQMMEGTPVVTFPVGTSYAYVCYPAGRDWTHESLLRATEELAASRRTDRWPSGPMKPDHERQDLTTIGTLGTDDQAYTIDTLTLPYDNPYRALFFCSGVDSVPGGLHADLPGVKNKDLMVVTTVHGDVWGVEGVDESLRKLRWRRFASGLYQPLGVKVIDGQIYVLERGQITILKDSNGDGIADRYECFCGDWHIGGGEHSYHTSLETDLEGNFYFHVGGDHHVPTGGTLIKVLADGSRSEVFSTGFRHPIGLGALPDGRITGADQEGNWMPSTRLDIYKQGGFYGDMRAHHREVLPETFNGPLCWIPRQLDGSAGGQVFVDREDFGPLSGHLLHMSFGACKLMLVLMQEHAGAEQAGVIDLGLEFLAGIQRGRFRESDGHLYLAGMDGWQTAAQADGCLQRVRFTGKPMHLPTELTVENGGIRLRFNVPIVGEIGEGADAGSVGHVATDPARYNVEIWNYLWSKEYGSRRYSVEQPGDEGQDVLEVESATVLDPWTVFLKVPRLQPCMQTQIEYDILAYADGAEGEPQRLKGTLYSTIHTTGPAIEFRDGERVALIGGTLIEREQRYGYWEHAITTAYPEKNITFRNLGWAADTVWADSRGIFDPAEMGYARLIEQVGKLEPSLFLLNYGGNEAWESLRSGESPQEAVERFVAQYGKLIDDLTAASSNVNGDRKPGVGDAGSAPRFALLTPLPMESGVGPNSDPSEYNAHLAKYTAAIDQLAQDRGLPCINLADLHDWYTKQTKDDSTALPLTHNGLHLCEYGYWRTAAWIRERLCAGTTTPSVVRPGKNGPVDAASPGNSQLERIKVDPLTDEQQRQETICLEFDGRLSVLPQPLLVEQVGVVPEQRYLLLTPGRYRIEIDGAVVARGTDEDWFEGRRYTRGPDQEQSQALLEAIRRKNELYFHRWRPQNVTYLFLFRKHEQGNNAVEIPQFDPLIAAEEQRIAELRKPQRRSYKLVREQGTRAGRIENN